MWGTQQKLEELKFSYLMGKEDVRDGLNERELLLLFLLVLEMFIFRETILLRMGIGSSH